MSLALLSKRASRQMRVMPWMTLCVCAPMRCGSHPHHRGADDAVNVMRRMYRCAVQRAVVFQNIRRPAFLFLQRLIRQCLDPGDPGPEKPLAATLLTALGDCVESPRRGAKPVRACSRRHQAAGSSHTGQNPIMRKNS